MPVIIPAGYLQAVITHQSANIANGTAVTVLGFEVGGAGGVPALQVAADDISQAWRDNMIPFLDNETFLASVTAQTATDAATNSTTDQGDQSYTDPPPNVAMLIRHDTTIRGPRGRGRTFLYGALSENLVDARGRVDPGLVTAVQGAWDGFRADLEAVDQPLLLTILQGSEGVSPFLNPPPNVSNSTVQAMVASQRRRLRP